MKINVINNNKKYIINVNKYISINSILFKFYENTDDYYIDYNGIYLDKNYSLDKYNITDDCTIMIHKKLKGGKSKFIRFVRNNWILSIFILLIVLLPCILLPVGYISSFSTMLKVIFDRSIDSVSKFLVCKYGKISIVSRIHFVFSIFKFFIFILMIYITITLPITILFLFLKGHQITDKPELLCKPINYGGLTGMFLTFIYFFLYVLYRGLNKFLNFFIDISNSYYTSQSTLSQILIGFKEWYNKAKYTKGIILPDLSVPFLLLDNFAQMFESSLSSVISIGCKFDTSKLTKMTSSLNNSLKEKEKEKENKESGKSKKNKDDDDDDDELFNIDFPMCNTKTSVKCCSEDNFMKMGDFMFKYVTDPSTSILLDKYKQTISAILIVSALYKKVLENKDNTIKEENIDRIKENMNILDSILINYTQKEGISYSKEKYSLTNKLLENIYINAFCNVITTANSTQEVIRESGSLLEIVDMYKSGIVCGTITAVLYFIVVIVIIICAILGIF
jgi:hypothetical protein